MYVRSCTLVDLNRRWVSYDRILGDGVALGDAFAMVLMRRRQLDCSRDTERQGGRPPLCSHLLYNCGCSLANQCVLTISVGFAA